MSWTSMSSRRICFAKDCCAPLSRLSPVSSSAHSAESAGLQQLTFNALNLYEIDVPRQPVRRVTASISARVVRDLVESGEVTPAIERSYSLSEVPAASRR